MQYCESWPPTGHQRNFTPNCAHWPELDGYQQQAANGYALDYNVERMNLVERRPSYVDRMQTAPHTVHTTSPEAVAQPGHPQYLNRGDSWFPSHPNCPNHSNGTSFNDAFANPNQEGQVSCPDCFIRSAIMQSMSAMPSSCPHLHACHNCTFCYAQQWPRGDAGHSSVLRQGLSPPLYHGSPLGAVGSPPMVGESPQSGRVYSAPGSPYSRLDSPVLQQPYTNVACEENHQQLYLDRFNQPLEVPRPVTTLSHSPRRPAGSIAYSNSGDFQLDSRQPVQRPGLGKTGNDFAHLNGETDLLSREETVNGQKRHDKTSAFIAIKKDTTVRKRSADDVCQVCGDRASGYHYNALTCEGCKGFFRRSINKKEVPARCKYGGACVMDTYTRRKCPECRLKKCREVGMLEECLLTEIQCQSKRRSRNIRRAAKDDSRRSPNSRGAGADELSNSSSCPPTPESAVSSITAASKATEDECALTEKDKELIAVVGKAFEEYRTNPEIMERWGKYLKNSTKLNLCEISTIHVKVLVEFTKKLPGFNHLEPEDQISLLKGSFVEAMILRNCCGYNYRKSEINVDAVAEDVGMHAANMKVLVEFFIRTNKLDMDDIEFGLLIAVNMFDSDHYHAQSKDKIDEFRDRYLATLSRYCRNRKPHRPQILAKILGLLTDMRTLYHTYTQIVSTWKERDQMTPLLCEIWDAPSRY